MVNNCINLIQNILFQPSCLLCGQVTHSARSICRRCSDKLPVVQYHCRICSVSLPETSSPGNRAGLICPSCQTLKPSYDTSIVPYLYQAGISELIQQFKFHHNLTAGLSLAQLFVDKLSPDHDLPELLLPVPLHPSRLRQRGFNQAHWLASKISALTGINVDHGIIARSRKTVLQHTINRAQRLQNLRQAFHLNKPLKSGHIAIVDDVMTTGATVEAIAKIIRQSSQMKIDVWTMARTPYKYTI